MGQQVFADWYKMMITLYEDPEAQNLFLDLKQAQDNDADNAPAAFINAHDIGPMQRQLITLGQLTMQFQAPGSVQITTADVVVDLTAIVHELKAHENLDLLAPALQWVHESLNGKDAGQREFVLQRLAWHLGNMDPAYSGASSHLDQLTVTPSTEDNTWQVTYADTPPLTLTLDHQRLQLHYPANSTQPAVQLATALGQLQDNIATHNSQHPALSR